MLLWRPPVYLLYLAKSMLVYIMLLRVFDKGKGGQARYYGYSVDLYRM